MVKQAFSSTVLRLWSTVTRIDPYLWLVIAFSLFAVLPLAGPNYFFDAHDAPHHVFFLTEFDAALRDGVWYPGWATDQALGYGYPTFVLYPPLVYYLGEGFLLLGAGKVAAIKWVWALATVGSGLSMYAYARHVMGRQRGLLAAIVYVYVPYHLADIYVRSALTEYSAFVWMPLALLAFDRLVEEATPRRVGLAGLAYGALWMTHNPTGLAFTPLLALYVLFRLLAERASWRDRFAPAVASLGAALLGLGIAAALLLPNLFERSFINQEQWVRAGYDYSLHFVYPFHLLSSSWGYAPGTPGTKGGMSFQLGAVPLILALVTTVGALRRPARERALILFFAGASLLLLFSILPISAPVWELLPLAALVQFPWRLLAPMAVTLGVLSGLAISREQGTGKRDSAPAPIHRDIAPSPGLRALAKGQGAGLNGQVLVLALVAVLASFPYTLPQYTPIPEIAEGPLLTIEFEMKYTDMRGMTAWTREFPTDSPLVEQYRAGGPLVTAEALAPGASVEMIRAGGASDELWVRSTEGTALQFYTYYFPGWRVYVDGERLPDEAMRPEGAYGLLTVDVPPGEHRVLLRWGDTPLRLAGKILTLACLALATALAVPWRTLGKRRRP
jgi:4-amino-4-deoxy-L-arabinose transferase-like glycosyltransferase